jgi:hypothetical protein
MERPTKHRNREDAKLGNACSPPQAALGSIRFGAQRIHGVAMSGFDIGLRARPNSAVGAARL